ncbi:hypothetical protein [Aeromicrobium sp.]|uniref:hypothetical protein n=1 Tax=Aeromicrobium sp. TaxID=1871063 RepID=UPI003D6C3190
MRRVGLVMLALGVLTLGVGAVTHLFSDDDQVDPYAQFLIAHLDVISEGPVYVDGDARFSRTISRGADLGSADSALDACAGPVAVDLGESRPVLVAEHDYCGGSVWIPKLDAGDVVSLVGPGIRRGLYVADDIKLVPRDDSRVRDLPDAAVVLQTCISQTTMVLVGLQPAVADAT